MTPTEKKYSKLIGNMYWEDVSTNRHKGKGEWEHLEGKMLILIAGIQKGGEYYFTKRDFYYNVQIISRPFPCRDNEESYLLRCKRLEECLKGDLTFHPVDSNEQATV